MQLTIATIGKFHNRALWTLAGQYAKRLKPFIKTELMIVRSEEKLLEKLENRDELILLEEKGESLSSADFAKKIQRFRLRGWSRLVFVVGPAEGFSDKLRARPHWTLSLSPLTFQHELALVLLMEQIYRAFTILHGTPYHK